MTFKPRKSSEKDTQATILQWLEWNKIFHFRNNTGAMVSEYKGKQRFMRFGASGSPDIFIIRNNICIGVEVKSEKGKQSETQIDFMKRFESAGGKYILVHSFEEFEETFYEITQNKKVGKTP